jgi:hypothetical protein
MEKKKYIAPAMQVHVIQTPRLLSGSGASVRSVSDTFYWEDTIDGEDR